MTSADPTAKRRCQECKLGAGVQLQAERRPMTPPMKVAFKARMAVETCTEGEAEREYGARGLTRQNKHLSQQSC